MKVLFKLTTILSLIFVSCSPKKPPVKTEKVSLALSCETTKYQDSDREEDPKLFSCQFPEFKIFVYKVPTMANQEYVEQVYSWFKQNAFYGPEIHTLQGIFFDGNQTSGRSFGSYNPAFKLISLFPNNTELHSEHLVPDSFATRMGVDKVDPLLDYRYWIYTIHHEYNHHSSFFYGSNGEVKTNNFGGHHVHDLGVSANGNKFLAFTQIDKVPAFKDHFKVDPIKPFSGGAPGILWPEKFFPVSFNQYLWTKAELLARALALYTFPVPAELQNEKSVNAYGGIIEDYWWFHYYKANIYETHKTQDKERKPIQEPVDKHFKEWSKFMDDEWFNDDANFGEVYNDYTGKIYLTSLYKAKNIKLVNTKDKEDTVLFNKLDNINNLKYYWRPFDSRKAKQIKLESNIYKASQTLKKYDKYQLLYKDKAVKEAFDLKDKETIKLNFGEKHYIEVVKSQDKIYFQLFDIKK